jgi:hypothetical protein
MIGIQNLQNRLNIIESTYPISERSLAVEIQKPKVRYFCSANSNLQEKQ